MSIVPWTKSIVPCVTLPLLSVIVICAPLMLAPEGAGEAAVLAGRHKAYWMLYIGSFISVVNTSSACDFGRGRLWSVHYTERDTSDQNPQNGTATTGSVYTYGPKRLSGVSRATRKTPAAVMILIESNGYA